MSLKLDLKFKQEKNWTEKSEKWSGQWKEKSGKKIDSGQ
jgi:hypothetical protein